MFVYDTRIGYVYFDQYGFSRFVDRYVPADQMDIRKSCVALADDLYRFFVGRYRLSGEWNIADCAAIDIHLDVETNVFQYALFRDAAHEASRTGVIDHAPGLPKRKMEEMIETFPFRYNEVIRIVFREVGLKAFRAGCCSTTP